MDEIYEFVEGYEILNKYDEYQIDVMQEKDLGKSNFCTFIVEEENSSIITYKINRYYDGVDFSEKKIKIMIQDQTQEILLTDVFNVKRSECSIEFSYKVLGNVIKNDNVSVYVCFL